MKTVIRAFLFLSCLNLKHIYVRGISQQLRSAQFIYSLMEKMNYPITIVNNKNLTLHFFSKSAQFKKKTTNIAEPFVPHCNYDQCQIIKFILGIFFRNLSGNYRFTQCVTIYYQKKSSCPDASGADLLGICRLSLKPSMI